MGERDQAINYLAEIKKQLVAKREKFMRPVQEVDKELAHVSATLALVLRRVEPIENGGEFPLAKLRGLSQAQAVIAIAKHNGGIVKAQDAKRIMIRAGILRETKNSTNIVHNAIIRGEKFERTGRGEFRLKETKPKTDDPHLFQVPVN